MIAILLYCRFDFFLFFFFFFKQKTAYEIRLSLVGSEMCIRDRVRYAYAKLSRHRARLPIAGPAPSPPRHPRRGDCQEPPPPFLLQDPTVRGDLGRKCVPKPPHLRPSCSSHPHSKAGKQTGAPVSHL